MGFYTRFFPRQERLWVQSNYSPVVWGLLFFTALALAAMTAAAFPVAEQLWVQAFFWDRFLILLFLSLLFLFLLVFFFCLGVRKFVALRDDALEVGFFFHKMPFCVKHISRENLVRFSLERKGSSPNRAYMERTHPDYYNKGHWRIVAEEKGGGKTVIDREVEREALEDFYHALESWRKRGT